MKILYSLINGRENFWCERVFAPALDFENILRENNIPLYALESSDPLTEFDFVGFTVQYELCYTNILNMLDLAGIPLRAEERGGEFPLVIAGGPCVCNPEPLAEFIDIFVLGEGEEVTLELLDLYANMKKQGFSKPEFLEKAALIEGVYIPSFYDVSYNDDKTVKAVVSNNKNAPPKIRKRIVSALDGAFYPDSFVVPYGEIVHDRAVVEVLRGCIRGCRFCQAGFIYRPFREKSVGSVVNQTKSLCENTGYDEVSLSSLSTSDFSDINGLLAELTAYTEDKKVNLSMPSMRIDRFNEEMLRQLAKVRKSGLTFAPEAGTQRLRDVINKNIAGDEIKAACSAAFSGGYCSVKLYFMLGLPTETEDDIKGIAELAGEIARLYYTCENRPKGKRLQISISCATFIPKPFTPFEFEPQASPAEVASKQALLLENIKSRKNISVSWHDINVSVLEAVLARGDRRLSKLIYEAWASGCRFDAWSEHFRFDLWTKAAGNLGIDFDFYTVRKREYSEIFPWDHLDFLVSKEFLIRENKAAKEEKTTKNCREKCSACGVGAAGTCVRPPESVQADSVKTEPSAPSRLISETRATEEEPKIVLRAIFEKTGKAVFISQLDLVRAMQRAMKRADIPVWHSKGFNPHIYISVPLALPVGTQSRVEIMEFAITHETPLDEICRRLNAALPDGLKMSGISYPSYPVKEISFAQYRLEFFSGTPRLTAEKFNEFVSGDEIHAEKRTKAKGTVTIDLKPHFELISSGVGAGAFEAIIKLPAGLSYSIGANVFTQAFENYSGLYFDKIITERIKFLNQ